MPKRIIGVSSRLIAVAKEEFLQKGFEGAVIKEIAAKADTSPRAIYTRFANKEDLFCCVVNPVVEEFYEQFEFDKEDYWNGNAKTVNSAADYYIRYLEFAYAHREEFLILLTKSKGTKYAHFTQMLAEADIKHVMAKTTEELVEFPGNMVVTELFINQITYAFYDSLFVPFIRGDSLEVAKGYITMMVDFYLNGLSKLVKI